MQAVKGVGLDPKNEIYVTIAYFLIDGFKDTILGLPWSLYSTFVIEERRAFSTPIEGLVIKEVYLWGLDAGLLC